MPWPHLHSDLHRCIRRAASHCSTTPSAPPQSSAIDNISLKQYVKQLIILQLVNQANKLFPE